MPRPCTGFVGGAALVMCTLLFAAPTQAIPTYPNRCPTCHPADAQVVVAVDLVAIDSTTATYSVLVSSTAGPAGWAVFSDAAKLGYGLKAAGQIAVPVGGSYTVFGVAHQTNHSGSVLLSPVAPSVLPMSRPTLAPFTPRHARWFRVSGRLGRPSPVAATVTLVIQRRVGGVYRSYARRTGSIAALASSYGGRALIRTSGRYRIRVSHSDLYDLASLSPWRVFSVR